MNAAICYVKKLCYLFLKNVECDFVHRIYKITMICTSEFKLVYAKITETHWCICLQNWQLRSYNRSHLTCKLQCHHHPLATPLAWAPTAPMHAVDAESGTHVPKHARTHLLRATHTPPWHWACTAMSYLPCTHGHVCNAGTLANARTRTEPDKP
jgi:hypothetical protein